MAQNLWFWDNTNRILSRAPQQFFTSAKFESFKHSIKALNFCWILFMMKIVPKCKLKFVSSLIGLCFFASCCAMHNIFLRVIVGKSMRCNVYECCESWIQCLRMLHTEPWFGIILFEKYSFPSAQKIHLSFRWFHCIPLIWGALLHSPSPSLPFTTMNVTVVIPAKFTCSSHGGHSKNDIKGTTTDSV